MNFIIYCDDNPKWPNTYRKNHSNEFEIETIINGADSEPTLKNLIKQGKPPAIIPEKEVDEIKDILWLPPGE